MLIKNNRGLVEGTFKLCMENSWFNEKLKSTVWSSNFNSAFFLSRLNLVFNPHGRTSSSCSYEQGVWNVNLLSHKGVDVALQATVGTLYKK